MLTESLRNEDRFSLRERIARSMLKLLRWKVVSRLPPEEKFVIVAAPHTSLWDYPLALLYCRSLKTPCYWLAHHYLFRGPLGIFTRALGGVRLDASNKNIGFVNHLIHQFEERDSFALALTPEGTSAFVPRWRTGFYYTALGAGVPIAFGFIDYKSKSLGIGGYFTPTGDAAKDLAAIKSFYDSVEGKNPDKSGPVKL